MQVSEKASRILPSLEQQDMPVIKKIISVKAYKSILWTKVSQGGAKESQ
jgi:hypothetical protein